MKERLLVMNGQKIVQQEENGQWKDAKVEKAQGVKPGIYSLYLATQADKTKTHSGVIVHANKENVFQQIGKNFVQHSRSDFDKLPELGVVKSISYTTEGKATVGTETIKFGQKRTI